MVMDGANAATRNKAIALALCSHLSVDPNRMDGKTIEESDVRSLVSSIISESQNQDEVLKWVEFASSFDGKFVALNDDLAQKSVLVGPAMNSQLLTWKALSWFFCNLFLLVFYFYLYPISIF